MLACIQTLCYCLPYVQAHVRFTRSNLTVEVQGGSTAVLPVRDPHCPTPVTPAAPAVVDLPAGLTWSLKLTVRSQYDLEQLSQPPVSQASGDLNVICAV